MSKEATQFIVRCSDKTDAHQLREIMKQIRNSIWCEHIEYSDGSSMFLVTVKEPNSVLAAKNAVAQINSDLKIYDLVYYEIPTTPIERAKRGMGVIPPGKRKHSNQ